MLSVYKNQKHYLKFLKKTETFQTYVSELSWKNTINKTKTIINHLVKKTNKTSASTTTQEEFVVKNRTTSGNFEKKQSKKKGWANNQGQLAFSRTK